MEQYYKKYEERYQAVYAAGADMWGYVPENEDLNKILAEWVEKQNLVGKTVLETCCGEGGAGVILSKLGCKYHGVDVAPSALKTAERLLAPYETASIALVDLVEDELQGQYDAAFDAMGFHMLLTDRDRKAYLENVYRALKPGAPLLFFRESYREDAYEGEVTSYEQYIEILGGGYDTPVKKYAKKGSEKVEVMIPRMPGRHQTEKGYRKELEAAGFIVDDFQIECGWNGWRPFASIWVHRPDCGKCNTMPNIKLARPTIDMKAEAMQFKQAFYDAGERTIYGSYKLDQDRYSYEQWLEILDMNLSTETANPKFGTSETYFAQNPHGELVGICNLRHTLTPFYQDSGHIGISVHPNSRQKGYGKEILLLLLERARIAGMTEVILVCSEDNEPSRRTILSCEGVLARTFFTDGKEKEEYVIHIPAELK